MTDPLDDDMTEPKVETAAPIEPAKPEVLPPQSQLPVKAQVQAQQNVMVIMPTNIEECYRAAELFKLAGMVPESLQAKNGDHRETVAKVALAIMKGSEVGMGPVTAVGTIMVINNKASIYGDGARALVLASGKIEYEKSEISGTWEGKDYVVSVTMKRWDMKEPLTRSFGYKDAQRAGLIGKGGPSAPWTKYPERQVYWRAWSWAARDAAADALSGLAVFEEVSDYETEQRRLHEKTDTSSLDDAPAKIEHKPQPKDEQNAMQS